MESHIERTLVLLKPDAVKRGIAGELIHRFERTGLKIVGIKLTQATPKLAKLHYNATEKNYLTYGTNTLNDCKKYGIDAFKILGTNDAIEIGKVVWGWNLEFLLSGPVVAIVFEGLHAIENVRTLCGSTIPLNAIPGTIRGDFSLDSAIGADLRKRTIYNLVHASGTKDEAKREIALWFNKKEIFSYKRIHEDLYRY